MQMAVCIIHRDIDVECKLYRFLPYWCAYPFMVPGVLLVHLPLSNPFRRASSITAWGLCESLLRAGYQVDYLARITLQKVT
jgi:hypothetical protein